MLEQLLDNAETWVPGAARTLVSQGSPAADCGLLGVWLERVDTGAPGGVKAPCNIQPRGWFHVTYWGCTPLQKANGDPPDAADITVNALEFATVGGAMWSGIVTQWHAGTLWDDMGCEDMDLSQGMRVLPPQGGLAGWDATIIVTL